MLGFANSVLWPACHMLIQHLEFRDEHWERYRDVNQARVEPGDECVRQQAGGLQSVGWRNARDSRVMARRGNPPRG